MRAFALALLAAASFAAPVAADVDIRGHVGGMNYSYQGRTTWGTPGGYTWEYQVGPRGEIGSLAPAEPLAPNACDRAGIRGFEAVEAAGSRCFGR